MQTGTVSSAEAEDAAVRRWEAQIEFKLGVQGLRSPC